MEKVDILDQLIFFQKNIRDEEDAYNLYKGLYSTSLLNTLENKNFKEFFALEYWGYIKLIKIFDNQNHFNKCTKIFDNILEDAFKKKIFNCRSVSKHNNKIAFYILNLNFLAHVEVFLNFLENIDQDRFSKCHVDIFTTTPLETVDKKIKNLCKVLNINIINFSKADIYAIYQSIIDFYIENGYKNLIFLSNVLGISFLSKSLPDNVSHFVHKYGTNSFKSLKHIYTYDTKHAFDLSLNTKIFFYNFKINFKDKLINCNFKNKKIKFYTINREEKIKDVLFLNCIQEVLNKFPDSTFSWTGRKKDKFIENFFEQCNLGQRVFYIGWADIDKLGLKYGDIFLDTNNLSGLIAAKTLSSGIPTVFFNNSTFWLNSFIAEIKNDNSYNIIEKEIIDDWYGDLEGYKDSYLNIVSKISTDKEYFNNYINLSIKLSKKFFDNSRNKKEANFLFENMIS